VAEPPVAPPPPPVPPLPGPVVGATDSVSLEAHDHDSSTMSVAGSTAHFKDRIIIASPAS
jgi:hypothetical protein